MSRIGKKAIPIPAKVKVSVSQAGSVTIEGPKGKLEWTLPKTIAASIEGEQLSVTRANDQREQRALHGLSRALLAG